MEKLPLLYESRPVGELTVRQEGEDTLFSAACRLPEQGLWCLWAVGREGTLRLGCPEQQQGEVRLSRRFSPRMTVPLGKVIRGEVRKALPVESSGWERVQAPERLFRTQWLSGALRGCGGVLTRRKGQVRLVAVPFSVEKPFPLVSLFCFARICTLENSRYAVFAFNREEWPIFQSLENL